MSGDFPAVRLGAANRGDGCWQRSEVVALLQEEGFARFNLHHHAQLWKRLDEKNPGKGYGVSIANKWYWEAYRQHALAA